MIKTIPIFFSLLVIVCTVRASEPPLGMWAWKQTHFDTAQARSEMLDFCEQEGISHIDQHVVIHNNIITNETLLLTISLFKRSTSVLQE